MTPLLLRTPRPDESDLFGGGEKPAGLKTEPAVSCRPGARRPSAVVGGELQVKKLLWGLKRL